LFENASAKVKLFSKRKKSQKKFILPNLRQQA